MAECKASFNSLTFNYMKNNGDLVLLALQYYGTTAVPGDRSNPLILGFFQLAKHIEVKDDDIPWCSAFMNAICKQVGAPTTDSLMARSWLEKGQYIKEGQFGDVVIFWRDKVDGWSGHVGLVIANIGKYLWVLGGNQSNMVKIEMYSKEKVLGYRRLMP